MTPLYCDKCKTVLPGAVVNTVEPVACPGCHAPLLAQVFPAFFRADPTGKTAENVLSDEDASCFYHPAKKAVVPCGRCGRFLCSLCDIDLGNNRHVCPGCAEAARLDPAARNAGSVALPESKRLLYDQLACFLAVMPLFFWPATLLTAPVALFLGIRYWKEPLRGPLPRSRVRLVVAMLFALAQIAGWATLGFFLLYGRRTHVFG